MNTKTPPSYGGFFVGLSQHLESKRAGNSRPAFFALPVAEATAAVWSGMPAGRAVVHRTAAASRPAVPARSAAAGHRNGGAVGCHRPIERSCRHGLRCRHRRQAETDREQGHCDNFHGNSFLLVRDENVFNPTPFTLPMAVMPVTAVPTPMPVPMPVAMMPAHFFRLDMIDVVLRNDSGLRACRRGSQLHFSRCRRKRRGLAAGGKRRAARHKSHRQF
jgi:hypothetical protein